MMRDVSRASILGLVVLASCGGSGSRRYGNVTDDGMAAIHEFCGEHLEFQSTVGSGSDDLVYGNPDQVLELHCELPSTTGLRGLSVDIDSKSKEWLQGSFQGKPEEIEMLLKRVLVPVLEKDVREGMDGLHQVLRSHDKPPGQSWDNGELSLHVTPYSKDNWTVIAVHLKHK